MTDERERLREALCTICSWTGEIGAEAHARVIHGDNAITVQQMGRTFVVWAMKAIEAAADPYGWHADGDLCLGPECMNTDENTGEHSTDVHSDDWWEGFAEHGRRAGLAHDRPSDLDSIVAQIREDIEEAERDIGHALDTEAIGNIVYENLRAHDRPSWSGLAEAERRLADAIVKGLLPEVVSDKDALTVQYVNVMKLARRLLDAGVLPPDPTCRCDAHRAALSGSSDQEAVGLDTGLLADVREAVQDATKVMTWALSVILAVRAWRDTPRDPRKMHESAALDQAILDAIGDFDYYAAGIPDGLPGPDDDLTETKLESPA